MRVARKRRWGALDDRRYRSKLAKAAAGVRGSRLRHGGDGCLYGWGVGKTTEELEVENVGKIDPKKHLENNVEELMSRNIDQTLGNMLATVVF